MNLLPLAGAAASLIQGQGACGSAWACAFLCLLAVRLFQFHSRTAGRARTYWAAGNPLRVIFVEKTSPTTPGLSKGPSQRPRVCVVNFLDELGLGELGARTLTLALKGEKKAKDLLPPGDHSPSERNVSAPRASTASGPLAPRLPGPHHLHQLPPLSRNCCSPQSKHTLRTRPGAHHPAAGLAQEHQTHSDRRRDFLSGLRSCPIRPPPLEGPSVHMMEMRKSRLPSAPPLLKSKAAPRCQDAKQEARGTRETPSGGWGGMGGAAKTSVHCSDMFVF